MTQHNAQSTSEPTISENDLIAQRHAKLKQIQEQAHYNIETTPVFDNFENKELLLLTILHCINYYITIVAAAS